MLSRIAQRHLGKVSLLACSCQLLLVYAVLQLEPKDPLMSLADGGFLLLPLSLLLLAAFGYAVRSKCWLLAGVTLPASLLGLLLGSFSVYMLSL